MSNCGDLSVAHVADTDVAAAICVAVVDGGKRK